MSLVIGGAVDKDEVYIGEESVEAGVLVSRYVQCNRLEVHRVQYDLVVVRELHKQ